ncbi:unnamed protein product [Moneuplotes crassus]|uniref:Uncharacterized protein n=1 Tax=Euplotes crassus TaxID=5936 RepID=A0AAD1XY56_EUPCR|nr:unnamed protein product [Moneuplotes crassus]
MGNPLSCFCKNYGPDNNEMVCVAKNKSLQDEEYQNAYLKIDKAGSNLRDQRMQNAQTHHKIASNAKEREQRILQAKQAIGTMRERLNPRREDAWKFGSMSIEETKSDFNGRWKEESKQEETKQAERRGKKDVGNGLRNKPRQEPNKVHTGDQDKQAKENIADYDYLSMICKEVTGQSQKYTSKSKFVIDLSVGYHLEFLFQIRKRMPDLDKFIIKNIPSDRKGDVKVFLQNYFPQSLNTFCFNIGADKYAIGLYMNELKMCCQRVLKEIRIHDFDIRQKNFVSLLSLCKTKDSLIFINCTIYLSSVPKLEKILIGSTLRKLGLARCGCSTNENRGTFRSHFQNLMSALSKCNDFKRSFEELYIPGCGVKSDVISQILKDNGFATVELCIS